MNGQWIGIVSGTINGAVILNLDSRQDSYEGRITVLNSVLENVSIVAQVKINKNEFDSNTGCFKGELYNFLPIRQDSIIGNRKDFPASTKDQISEIVKIDGCRIKIHPVPKI